MKWMERMVGVECKHLCLLRGKMVSGLNGWSGLGVETFTFTKRKREKTEEKNSWKISLLCL